MNVERVMAALLIAVGGMLMGALADPALHWWALLLLAAVIGSSLFTAGTLWASSREDDR